MGALTAAELLDAALDGTLTEDGEIVSSPAVEAEGEPAAEPQADQQGQQAAQADGNQPEPQPAAAPADTEVEGAPVLSKSGAYTIPYEKLAEAREGRKAALERVAQLEQQLAELSAQQQQNLAAAQADAQDRANAGKAPTAADAHLAAAEQAIADGADVSLFGDFTEEAIARGNAELARREGQRIEARVMAALETEIAPLREKVAKVNAQEARDAEAAHYEAILSAHPDAKEIIQSIEFAAWRDSLPAFSKAGVSHALENGTSQDVIEVFNAFRATSKPQPHPQPANPAPQPAAPEAIKPRVPNSLSEVPGAAPIDSTQQVLAAAGNTGALLDRMSSMTPDQLDALMDRI